MNSFIHLYGIVVGLCESGGELFLIFKKSCICEFMNWTLENKNIWHSKRRADCGFTYFHGSMSFESGHRGGDRVRHMQKGFVDLWCGF